MNDLVKSIRALAALELGTILSNLSSDCASHMTDLVMRGRAGSGLASFTYLVLHKKALTQLRKYSEHLWEMKVKPLLPNLEPSQRVAFVVGLGEEYENGAVAIRNAFAQTIENLCSPQRPEPTALVHESNVERDALEGTLNLSLAALSSGHISPSMTTPASSNTPPYVSQERLDALRAIKSKDFDLKKLIRLCEELNSNYEAGNYYSTGILVRAILDHIPPVFSCSSFSQVCANYGTKSFKEVMNHLDKSSRKIGDGFLHEQIRPRESLPNSTSVQFGSALDKLLGEIAVKLQTP